MESFGFLDLRFYIYRCRTPPLPCTRSYSLLTIILYPRWKRAVKLRFAPFQSNPSFIVEAQLRCVIEARSENLLWRLTLSPKITRWALVLRLRWETVESASVDACASVYVLLLRSRRRSGLMSVIVAGGFTTLYSYLFPRVLCYSCWFLFVHPFFYSLSVRFSGLFSQDIEMEHALIRFYCYQQFDNT